MLKTFLEKAANDQSVYITDVREAFQARGTRPFHLHVTLYDRSVRAFDLRLPETVGEDEEKFVAEYVYANVYNLLSSLGGVGIDVYLDKSDKAALALVQGLDRVFQLERDKTARTGYGKCLNVNERVLAVLLGGEEKFSFGVHDVKEEPAVEPPAAVTGRPVFDRLPTMTRGRMVLGMDIGGTDVKLAVSVDGQLALCKEFDWFPASYPLAEQITGPILLMIIARGPASCQVFRNTAGSFRASSPLGEPRLNVSAAFCKSASSQLRCDFSNVKINVILF